MNAPLSRPQAAFQAAVRRLHRVAREAVGRCVDSLGLAALSSQETQRREALLAAQFDLNRNVAAVELAFAERLNELIQRELDRQRASTRTSQPTDWRSLTLVGDDEVEAQVAADRVAQAIRHACEWELRELDGYMGSLLQLQAADHERNPLRPDLVGKALSRAIEAASERPDVRRVAMAEMGRSLVALMPKVYGDIVAELRDAGLQPLGLAMRAVQTPSAAPAGRSTSGFESTGEPAGLASTSGAATGSSSRGAGRSGPVSGARGNGVPIGQVDAQMMSIIRRLAHLSTALPDTNVGAIDSGIVSASNWVAGPAGPVAPNLIRAHRDELRMASTGTLDHMVIDVVGSLFDQILSDPKVPPQMARQIARLQLPVLRVALGDPSFFSSRRHPVRRFVNRMASISVALDDLAEGPGKAFMTRVRELVQQIVEGDFDQMDVYERKLVELEEFVAAQVRQEVQQQSAGTVDLLEDKENGLILHQRTMQRLQAELASVAMPPFLRDFLAQVWSQAIVQAVRAGGETGETAQRMRRTARDLVLSVQPKGTPAERKAFVQALPQLMKDLNVGLAAIGWPEDGKKAFFGELLPLHADSLKSGAISQLDYNLLAKRLEGIFGGAVSGEKPPPGAVPVLDDVVTEQAFSAEEAQRIGLVKESAVDWDGKVDIDLSAEPEVTADDVRIEGLPAPDPVEPASGAALAQNVQLGIAYRMHLEDGWQKVRLTYVSPNRAFFVFTRGQKHQRTISMTARMLHRMCESGRLRMYENAYLIERATARARRQLSTLLPGRGATAH